LRTFALILYNTLLLHVVARSGVKRQNPAGYNSPKIKKKFGTWNLTKHPLGILSSVRWDLSTQLNSTQFIDIWQLTAVKLD